MGKTTLSLQALEEHNHGIHINWDIEKDTALVERGYDAIVAPLELEKTYHRKPIVIFDEIHKFSVWQSWLKGFFDEYAKKVRIIVTGSAKFDIYKSQGDSLMGRYFLYHVHPFSVAELLGRSSFKTEIRPPAQIDDEQFNRLLKFGGFPEPYIKSDTRFYNRWASLRHQQLFTREIRELTLIHEIAQVERLARILCHQIGATTSYSSFARKIQASSASVKRWLEALQSFYYCFAL